MSVSCLPDKAMCLSTGTQCHFHHILLAKVSHEAHIQGVRRLLSKYVHNILHLAGAQLMKQMKRKLSVLNYTDSIQCNQQVNFIPHLLRVRKPQTIHSHLWFQNSK